VLTFFEDRGISIYIFDLFYWLKRGLVCMEKRKAPTRYRGEETTKVSVEKKTHTTVLNRIGF